MLAKIDREDRDIGFRWRTSACRAATDRERKREREREREREKDRKREGERDREKEGKRL